MVTVPAATFAAVFAALFVAHGVGDHWVQYLSAGRCQGPPRVGQAALPMPVTWPRSP